MLSCSWSGVLEDEELQVQDAVANPSKRSNDSAVTRTSSSGRSPSVGGKLERKLETKCSASRLAGGKFGF
jgi:hypothetical protein